MPLNVVVPPFVSEALVGEAVCAWHDPDIATAGGIAAIPTPSCTRPCEGSLAVISDTRTGTGPHAHGAHAVMPCLYGSGAASSERVGRAAGAGVAHSSA